jgi:cytochrome c peroxidase
MFYSGVVKMKLLIFTLFLLQMLWSSQIFEPLPQTVEVDQQKVTLGKQLFFDPILSKNNRVACVSCHLLEKFGVDNLKVSIGIDGQKGERNTPTIYNAHFNVMQMWDGRAKTLKDQVVLPITNLKEMGETVEGVVKKLHNDRRYVRTFKMIYGEPITFDHVADVIAEFQKSLLTPNSRFDHYLRGNKNILTDQEKFGLALFKSKGCASCHNGVNIGGNHFQKLGYFLDDPINSNDLGRYLITKNVEDKRVFKVPSLRNVEKTAPYFHNGSVWTLREAVEVMIGAQLGILLEDQELDALVAFLKTLTGELPDE